MRHFSQAFLGAVLAALPAAVHSGEPSEPRKAAEIHSAFGPGEQSTFDVSYLGVSTGTATVTVGLTTLEFGQEVWPLVCTASTELSIYPVRDRFVSFWDYSARRNVGSEFFADENKKRRRDRFRYERDEKKIYATKQKEGGPPVEVAYDVPADVVDLASAAFRVRNRPLAVGDEFQQPIFTGLKTYQMHAKVQAREKLATILGEKECFRVTFTAEWTGMLAPRRELTLWFLVEPSHLPVRFEADLLLGSVVARLVSFYPGRDYTR